MDVTDWFFETVEAHFEFLREDYGFDVTMKNRHHEGNTIIYGNDTYTFLVQCAPDWDAIGAELVAPGPRERVILTMEQVGNAVGMPEGMTYERSSSDAPDVLELGYQMQRWRAALAAYLADRSHQDAAG